MTPLAVQIVYLLIGVAFALAAVVWFVAQMPDKPDFIDGFFAACVCVPMVALWPLGVLGVAITYLARRLHEAATASSN